MRNDHIENKRDSESFILLWITFSFFIAWGVFYVFTSDIKAYTDEMGHYLLSRYFWQHPKVMLSQWQRPLYTLLTTFPALLGFKAQRLVSVYASLICAVATIEIAKYYGIKRRYFIPFILASLPAYTSIMWTNLSEPLFTVILVLALVYHLKKRYHIATLLVGFTPLLRPEGAIVMLVWAVYYLGARKWKNLPLLFAGGVFWILAAWVITKDPLYPLQSSYRLSPSLRYIQWDYFLKFYDDYSGPVWFIAIVVGIIACRGFKFDIIHAVYGVIYLFFAIVRDNLEDLPPRHFGWRFMASTAPIMACYALKGIDVLLDGRTDWSKQRETLLTIVLISLATGWSIVAFIYLKKANEYGPMLSLLACLGIVASISWVSAPRIKQHQLQALTTVIIIIGIGFALFKAPPYKSNAMDIGIKNLAYWWMSDKNNIGKPVYCGLLGFYYYTNLDPILNRRSEHSLPGLPGDTVIWDSWAMGRWGRMSYKTLENAGYTRIPCPISIPKLDLRVYRKPVQSDHK